MGSAYDGARRAAKQRNRAGGCAADRPVSRRRAAPEATASPGDPATSGCRRPPAPAKRPGASSPTSAQGRARRAGGLPAQPPDAGAPGRPFPGCGVPGMGTAGRRARGGDTRISASPRGGATSLAGGTALPLSPPATTCGRRTRSPRRPGLDQAPIVALLVPGGSGSHAVTGPLRGCEACGLRTRFFLPPATLLLTSDRSGRILLLDSDRSRHDPRTRG